MKLQLTRDTLLKPLQMVIGVVERKQTLPILSNVLLKAHDQKLSITGTDLEVELIGSSSMAQAADDSSVTLPGRKLFDICKALPDDAAIELYQEKERVVVKSGRSRFTLSTLPASDFPNLEGHEAQLSFEVPEQDLRQLLQRTYFSMAQQDVRYYLNGLLFEVSDNTLRAVATDGHRLALDTINAAVAAPEKLQIIVPRKGVLELMRLLHDTDTNVTIDISTSHIRVENTEYTFTSKLVDGRFPDYERVIPKNGTKEIFIDRDEIKEALHRAAILCNEKFHGVRFELRNNLLRLFANNPEQEVAEEEVVIDYRGEEFDIGFNVNYLLDILNVLPAGPVKFILNNADSSMIIEEPSSKGESLYVVMPMRL